jgi:hypothetical protein
MKAIFVALTMTLSASALASQPTDASVRELLKVTESQKLVDASEAQMDSVMRATMQQAFKGQTVTPDIQESLDDMRGKMIALMRQEMRWDVLEPKFLDIYKQSFSQAEVDGMLAFYKSETGRAVIAKMPVVMQHTMQMMQQMMLALMPKLQAVQKETMAEVKAKLRVPNR